MSLFPILDAKKDRKHFNNVHPHSKRQKRCHVYTKTIADPERPLQNPCRL